MYVEGVSSGNCGCDASGSHVVRADTARGLCRMVTHMERGHHVARCLDRYVRIKLNLQVSKLRHLKRRSIATSCTKRSGSPRTRERDENCGCVDPCRDDTSWSDVPWPRRPFTRHVSSASRGEKRRQVSCLGCLGCLGLFGS